MRLDQRSLGVASVTVFLGVVALAIRFGASGIDGFTWVVGLVLGAFAVQAVRSEPRDLIVTLAAGLVLVITLLAGGAVSWLIPLASVLLFLGAELHAAAWGALGPEPDDSVLRSRLRDSLLLAVIGLLAGSVLFATRELPTPALPGVFLASLAVLAGLGAVFFRVARSPTAPTRLEEPGPAE